MKPESLLLTVILLLLTLAACGPTPASRRVPFQKGVNFTAERPAWYGTDEAARMLSQLPRYGINAIALVPYAATRIGSPTVRFHPSRSWEPDSGVERLAHQARQLGMVVLIKPHVWVPRGFPGDLDFPNPADRQRWFQDYRKFILHHAALAARVQANLFCIGVEFARLSVYENDWRNLIAEVRRVYPGPLVYAANFGEEFESVRFWDALDYIGLNNYYPLEEDFSAASALAIVRQVQRRWQRPVIFPEAGYSSMPQARRRPWAESDTEVALQEQARCYEGLLRAFYNQPWFQGLYWWKIGTNGFGGPQDASHTPWGKPAMEVMARWFLQGGRL